VKAIKSQKKDAEENKKAQASSYQDTFITESTATQLAPKKSPRIKLSLDMDERTSITENIPAMGTNRSEPSSTIKTMLKASENNGNDEMSSIRTAIKTNSEINDESSIKTILKANDSSVTYQAIESESRLHNNKQTTDSTASSSRSNSSSSNISENFSPSITNNSTTTTNDIQSNLNRLQNELKRKKDEVERLKRSLKHREKSKLKEKETNLRKKLDSYDTLISNIKTALADEEEESVGDGSSPIATVNLPKRVESKKVESKKVENKKVEAKKPIVKDNIRKVSTVESDASSLESDTIKTQIDNKSTVTSTNNVTTINESKPVRAATAEPASYDEDFSSEKNQTSRKSSMSESSPSPSSSSPPSSRKKTPIENEKSTVSEISDEIVEDLLNNERKLKLDFNLDEDNNSLSSSESSTDTQILLLVSNRDKKQEESKVLNEAANKKPEPAAVENVAASTAAANKKKDVIAKNLETEYINKEIGQLVDIRNKKMSKLLAEQYKEAINSEDEEEEEEEDEKKHEDEEKDSEDENKIQKIETDTNIIFIPSIDLSLDDYDEDDPFKPSTGKSKLNEKNKPTVNPLLVPYSIEKVGSLCDLVVDKYYWKKVQANTFPGEMDKATLNSNEFVLESSSSVVDLPAAKMSNKTVEEVREIERNFKKMLFDLVGELVLDLYLEKFEQKKAVSSFFPEFKIGAAKSYFKGLQKGPTDLETSKKLIKEKIFEILKLKPKEARLSELAKKPPPQMKSKWRTQRKLDNVDTLLDREMREQEFEWSNYEKEEYEAKSQLTSTIFDILLKDTIKSFQISFIKKNTSENLTGTDDAI
jgi:hypothetical protein